MKCNVEKLEKNQVKFTFDLTSEEWEQAVVKAYNKTKHKYSYPGFRKGKLPKHMIENMYGKGVFYEDAFNEVFPTYYGEALDKHKDIFPVARPDVDITKIDDKGATFQALVTVKPEVVLGEYKGIKYKKPQYEVSKKELDDALEQEREKLARMVDVKERATQDGDITTIDYSGSVDGKKFDGGTAEKQQLIIGSKSFIPGFEEQIIGMNIGEEKDVKVAFPKDYHAKDLAGKDAVFHVKLHEIKVKELPSLDNEFAKDVSEFSTLKEYKDSLKAKLAENKKQRVEWESENELVDKIAANAQIDIPAVMIENAIDEMVEEMSYRLMYQGLKFEDYLKYTGSNEKAYRDSCKKQAEKNVKTQLVVDKIIKTEKIEADKDSVDAKLKEKAKDDKKTLKEYKDGMDERQLSSIKNAIVTEKLFEFLKSNNIAE